MNSPIQPATIWINSTALKNVFEHGSYMSLVTTNCWHSSLVPLYTADQHETLRALYSTQCEATDEWHEAFLAERAAKSPERIAELEKQLAEMNQRYADLQEAMDRMAPYNGAGNVQA